MKSEKAIKKTAMNHSTSEQNVRDEMQKAIDVAWDTKDELALKRQKELFPNGKPTVEEFISKISKKASDKGNA